MRHYPTRLPGPGQARRGDQAGFTLIELMVVLLIIGILMAIAIPTYLGERSRAQDTAAESTLRNALGTLKGLYVQDQDFAAVLPDPVNGGGASISVVQAAEPALQWNANVSYGPNEVFVQGLYRSAAILMAKSSAGSCFWIMDVETSSARIIGDFLYSGTRITGAGVWYAKTPPGTSGGECDGGVAPGGWPWYSSTAQGWA